jgi:hypothetical protein
MRFLPTIGSVLVLASCALSMTSSLGSHDYSEIAEWSIPWSALFTPPEIHYLVWIYSPTCSHCQEIKNEMIDYAIKIPKPPLFFVKADATIPKGTNITKTLGADRVEQVFVAGWPTLLEIESGILSGHFLGPDAIRTELATFSMNNST